MIISFLRDPKRPFFLFSSFIFISLCFCSLFSNAENTISLGQSLTDGQTLISSDQSFEMGFFSPENSTSRYVGIWYNISTKSIVWVANRDNPISDKNGVFRIAGDGTLVVLDGSGNSVWSSNVSSSSSSNITAVLMDSGNLILSSSGKTYWESFNHPTDTYLPGMKVLVNNKLGENRVFRSWKSTTDPSTGNYTMGIDPRGSPQIVLWEGSSSIRRWRSGQWNGLIFIGIPDMPSNYLYGFKLSIVDGNGNMYFTYLPNDNAHLLKFRVSWEGYEEQMKWNETKNVWDMMQYQPANECAFYNKCGNFSVCTPNNTPTCSCIDGFIARDWNQWSKGNWSGGCVRRTELQCQSNSSESDGFKEVHSVKLPDFSDSGMTANTGDCKAKCLDECECKAYAYEPGIGCMLWREDLADIEQFSQNGRSLYVRLAHSDLGGRGRISGPVIAAIVVSITLYIIVMTWLIWHYRTQLKACSNSCRKSMDLPMHDMSRSQEFSTDFSGPGDVVVDGKTGKAPELPIYTLQCVSTATNNFANANRLGQGGFGPVFKGKFPGGQEIAVKRLSRRSGQGADEFKNEIILIAKLQHRNLVRLLGCCIEGEEKMLIYEYMPNKSLDCFLFDTAKQAELDWVKRFSIIEGIARGLLYLHRDSRLRIIHRDLKASNILLDEDMIPKISDFGMARIFGGNQNEEANTNRVVGTYGYMSPEYAMEGLFSVKSDVYSFGVLLLEVISGRRNTSFRETESSNLIRHAWNLWNEGKATELIDATIVESCSKNEVLRCIHIGMLCVQDSAAYRPTMSTVLLMLESENASMPIPKQPHTTGSMRSSSVDTADMWHEGQDMVSSSEITVSVVSGR